MAWHTQAIVRAHYSACALIKNRKKKKGVIFLAPQLGALTLKETQNVVADALSRRPHLSLMTDISEDWRHLILAEYGKDTWASGFIDGTIQNSDFTLVNEIIIYKGQFIWCQSQR